ncbi:translation initiation factor IF-2-like [Lutra lutra]|uniref:translation initiation factor IF-2-like n=1 Tax=Lutra lutra TaxID=9657 RepID=UPI001FCFB8BB|nr:translation initiation factor IF-2-like [Lutra lutra]XP_047562913.1 translation initiation factor IF-2-like [Lutra lutra]
MSRKIPGLQLLDITSFYFAESWFGIVHGSLPICWDCICSYIDFASKIKGGGVDPMVTQAHAGPSCRERTVPSPSGSLRARRQVPPRLRGRGRRLSVQYRRRPAGGAPAQPPARAGPAPYERGTGRGLSAPTTPSCPSPPRGVQTAGLAGGVAQPRNVLLFQRERPRPRARCRAPRARVPGRRALRGALRGRPREPKLQLRSARPGRARCPRLPRTPTASCSGPGTAAGSAGRGGVQRGGRARSWAGGKPCGAAAIVQLRAGLAPHPLLSPADPSLPGGAWTWGCFPVYALLPPPRRCREACRQGKEAPGDCPGRGRRRPCLPAPTEHLL